ncbi:MAG: FAD-binding protein [Betaproteobacteria bacterium]|nr:FAD-binding protein [Betaproteobacteria bacterium]
MNEGTQCDVVIVGGGMAGMIAANRAAQLDLRPLVLEQGADAKYPCNSRYTGGTFHICLREITLDEATLRQKILDSTAGFVKPELADVVAREGRRVIRWLQDEGMKFMRASASEYHKWVLAPPGRSRPGLDWEGRCGDVLLNTLERRLGERGGDLARGARARSLIMDGTRCVGVIAERNGKETSFHARAVFIADGGFQGDAALVGRYISRHPERLKQRGAGTGRGDGMKMASAVGAALVGMDRFYGHTLSSDALTNDNLWPYPYLDSLVTAGIVVDGAGRRFVDEGRGGVYVANAVARLDDPLSARVVFDAAIWEKAGRNGLIPPNPHLEREGATFHRAASLDALAAATRLPAEALRRTIAEYNDAVAAKRLQDGLTPPRQTARFEACPVATAPFFAVPMCAGITYTMGGISVNANAQVLRADGGSIEGLYALGAATGGLEGGPEVGYVGGLAKGGVTALVAAEHLAETIQRLRPKRG